MKAKKRLTLVELLLGLVVAAVLIWWYIARESEKNEQARIAAQEQQERDQREAERQAKQEVEKKAQEEARLAKEKAEREQHEQQRKADEQERMRKREQELLEDKARKSIDDAVEYSKMPSERAFWSARYRVLMAKYADAELGFISEAKSDEKPKGVTKRTNFWYVNLDYLTDRKIFEIEANPEGGILVHSLTESELPKELDSATFLRSMYSGKGVLMSGQKAWICGSGSDKRTVALRNLQNGFSPAESDLKDFQ